MKRTYRISVTVEATFDRKIRARTHAKNITAILSEALSEKIVTWKVVSSSVRTTKVTYDRVPKVTPPNPKQVARDALVASLQVHAEGMARLLGNVVKPRLRRHPSRVCWSGMRHAWAHAHTTNTMMYRFEKGKRTVRLGNLYGTICLSDQFLDQVLAAPTKVAELERVTGVVVKPADGLDTIAHEVAHLRVPKRSHRSAKFHEVADRLEREYRQVLSGSRLLPPKRAFGVRHTSPHIDAAPGFPMPGTGENPETRGPKAEPRQSEPDGRGEATAQVDENARPDRPTSLSAPATDNAVRESLRSASSLGEVSSDGASGRQDRPTGIAGAEPTLSSPVVE